MSDLRGMYPTSITSIRDASKLETVAFTLVNYPVDSDRP